MRRRIWHRLPWLLVGLFGAMLSAVVVAAFETQLERNVLIAFFVPAVVYMADAVGTQTETLVVRGLSVGVPIGEVLKRELITGADAVDNTSSKRSRRVAKRMSLRIRETRNVRTSSLSRSSPWSRASSASPARTPPRP